MFGYDDKRLADSVRQMILSGQAEIPQKLFEVDIPKKGTEKLRRSLQSSELWELHGDTVYNVFGVAFQGIASWGVGLTVRLAGRDYRFKVLHLDRFGKRIPIWPVDEKHFKTYVNVAVSPQFFGWIFSLGSKVAITCPDEVVDQMKQKTEELCRIYRPDGE